MSGRDDAYVAACARRCFLFIYRSLKKLFLVFQNFGRARKLCEEILTYLKIHLAEFTRNISHGWPIIKFVIKKLNIFIAHLRNYSYRLGKIIFAI